MSYYKSNGHVLKPHFDDRYLSGQILVNLSLCSEATMTYINSANVPFRVLLPPRSLQIVTKESRYDFTHSINNEDILGERRVSVVFRQVITK